MKYYSIAVDGPAGAGKSTIAKAAAKKLQFVYIDTGAMYRAMALFCIEHGIDIYNEKTVLDCTSDVDISISYRDGVQIIYLNGQDVTDKIRTESVSQGASIVSVYRRLREKMVDIQRELAKSANVIMDGREIASCVLPDADVKIYLTADVKERAKRRYFELIEKNQNSSDKREYKLEDIEKDIEERDYRDMNREVYPLVRVPEAVLIDTSNITIDEAVSKIIELYRNVSDDSKSCG